MTSINSLRDRNAFAVLQWICASLLVLALAGCVRSEDGLDSLDSVAGDELGDLPPGGSEPPAGVLPTPVGDMPPPVDEMPPPVDDDPPMDPPSLTDVMAFEQTLYPHLRDPANFCVGCHGATQIPTFAVDTVEDAYNVLLAQAKVDLVNAELSRIYLRAAEDRHNCGGVANCDRVAADFLMAIQDWILQRPVAEDPPEVAAVSASATLADAQEAGATRADAAVIAMFTFAEGSGDTTADVSGVGGPMNLAIDGMEWVDGGGLRNVSGKAQASLAESRKLFEMITPNAEYSVEAWVLPENTAQDGPARIVSYSQDTATRNFTLGQNAIYYQLRNRSGSTGANGTPTLEALDPQTDTVLQHVVATFSEADGRKVFVNGMLSIEENTPDTLAWTDDQQFVLGNEVTNDRLWQGVFRLVAVHSKALTPTEVQQNFVAGVEALRVLRFDVAEALGAPGYIEMVAGQIDELGYLFAEPTLVTDASPVAVKNIRIAVNGAVPVAEQAFRRVDTMVTESGTRLSSRGAVIPVALGAEMDQFHLEFELLGDSVGTVEQIAPPAPPPPLPDVEEPDLGVRTFSQVNDTMASLTGVDINDSTVRNAYQELIGALPSTNDLLAFSAAQQVAIQRLATTYCGEVVSDGAACADLFGSCSIDAGGKGQIGQNLFDRFVGADLVTQPAAAGVVAEVVSLIDDLGCSAGCSGAEAQTVLNASCAAVLASGATTIN